MKRFLLLFSWFLFSATSLTAARHSPTTGRVIDRTGAAVDYATVVLLRDGLQAAGTTTDSGGRFTLDAAPGDYTLQVSHLNYATHSQSIAITGGELDDIVLENASQKIDAVVVRAQLVRREADRFVVDVANAPSAIGKDGVELLERAPGVWVEDDKLSINGKSGSKVYINEREVKLSGEQLIAYIRNLRAEDIQQIEVIPISGAEYDADSASGIIKITLRRRRENGLQGSLSMQTRQSDWTEEYRPAGSIDLHSGRLDLRFSARGTFGNERKASIEHTDYADGTLDSRSQFTGRSKNFGGSFSSIVELNPRHSLGFGADYWRNRQPQESDIRSSLRTGMLRETDSRYEQRSRGDNFSATVNYLWRIDTLGSTFKVIGDYTRRSDDTDNDNRSTADGRDSLHRDYTRTDYTMASANAALEKNFSKRWSLRAGAKYTYYRMQSEALYEYNTTGAWLVNDNQSFDIDYTERIGALYGIVSGKFGRWGLVAGMRGEYTQIESDGSRISRDYLSLFPNANLSCTLDEKGRHMLVFQYARKISRPSFWHLNPQRQLISEYTYQTGNPNLDPSFSHDLSLTLVLAQKYSLTAGMRIQTDEIQQAIEPAEEGGNMLAVNWINYKDTKEYYANSSLPVRIAEWWEVNANLTYLYWGQRPYADGPVVYHHLVNTYISSTVTLPRKFYIDLAWSYHNRIHLGDSYIRSQSRINLTLKKRFGDRITANFTVHNLFSDGQKVGTRGDGFFRSMRLEDPWSKRMYWFRLTYNFKSGKAFRTRALENDAEGQSRL